MPLSLLAGPIRPRCESCDGCSAAQLLRAGLQIGVEVGDLRIGHAAEVVYCDLAHHLELAPAGRDAGADQRLERILIISAGDGEVGRIETRLGLAAAKVGAVAFG